MRRAHASNGEGNVPNPQPVKWKKRLVRGETVAADKAQSTAANTDPHWVLTVLRFAAWRLDGTGPSSNGSKSTKSEFTLPGLTDLNGPCGIRCCRRTHRLSECPFVRP
jgi:hypothetical protein